MPLHIARLTAPLLSCLAMTLAGATPAQAQDLATKNYWIGVLCAKNPNADDEKVAPEARGVEGLVVDDVVPTGPAAKAGIETHDILVAVGDKPLTDVNVLMAAVNESEGKPLKILVFRKGEQKEVEVTPGKREEVFAVPLPVPGGEPFNVRVFRPGRMLPGRVAIKLHRAELPEDMTVTITKKGKDPTKVVVAQGDKTWEATEENLDTLPEEVRGHVEPMLGRLAMPLPSGVGDVLTYVPNAADFRARAEAYAREVPREAMRQAEEAARAAKHEAREAAEKVKEAAKDAARESQQIATEKAVEVRRRVRDVSKEIDVERRLADLEQGIHELRKAVEAARNEAPEE